jgi:hypothetical protein
MPASLPSITVLVTRDLKKWLERRAGKGGVGPYVRKLIEDDRTRIEGVNAMNAAPTERSS